MDNNVYQEIIDGLTTDKIKQLLYDLGALDIKDTPNALITQTICHNINAAEASMKLYYYKDNHFFYCWTEDGGMSIFSFLKRYYETREIDYDWYEDIYLVAKNCSVESPLEGFTKQKVELLKDKYQRTSSTVELPIYSEGVLDVFTKYYPPEWLHDNISREAMDKFNILYSISQNKIIIPHYNPRGQLVGIRGRALNEYEMSIGMKYAPVQIEGKWYKHPLSMNPYGLNITAENIRKTGYAFIAESEKSVLQAESFSRPNCCVAVCGSNLNKYFLNVLMKECYPKEIVICFDKEELPKQSNYFNKLWSLCKKYNNYCNFSFIYDRDNLLELKDSPFDRGQDTFEKLLAKRVKVNEM